MSLKIKVFKEKEIINSMKRIIITLFLFLTLAPCADVPHVGR